jgi:hypothetical protein
LNQPLNERDVLLADDTPVVSEGPFDCPTPFELTGDRCRHRAVTVDGD